MSETKTFMWYLTSYGYVLCDVLWIGSLWSLMYMFFVPLCVLLTVKLLERLAVPLPAGVTIMSKRHSMVNSNALGCIMHEFTQRISSSRRTNGQDNFNRLGRSESTRALIKKIGGFCHSPVDFRAYSGAYPRLLPLMLMHKYRRENDKSQKWILGFCI